MNKTEYLTWLKIVLMDFSSVFGQSRFLWQYDLENLAINELNEKENELFKDKKQIFLKFKEKTFAQM